MWLKMETLATKETVKMGSAYPQIKLGPHVQLTLIAQSALFAIMPLFALLSHLLEENVTLDLLPCLRYLPVDTPEDASIILASYLTRSQDILRFLLTLQADKSFPATSALLDSQMQPNQRQGILNVSSLLIMTLDIFKAESLKDQLAKSLSILLMEVLKTHIRLQSAATTRTQTFIAPGNLATLPSKDCLI